MRKETIERLSADMKEKQGMRWTTLRGLRNVSMQAMLVYACMNLKKIELALEVRWLEAEIRCTFTSRSPSLMIAADC